MAPNRPQLIERAKNLHEKGFLDGYRSFEEWHEECIQFLERLQLYFREEIRTPLDLERAVSWLEKTFRQM